MAPGNTLFLSSFAGSLHFGNFYCEMMPCHQSGKSNLIESTGGWAVNVWKGVIDNNGRLLIWMDFITFKTHILVVLTFQREKMNCWVFLWYAAFKKRRESLYIPCIYKAYKAGNEPQHMIFPDFCIKSKQNGVSHSKTSHVWNGQNWSTDMYRSSYVQMEI